MTNIELEQKAALTEISHLEADRTGFRKKHYNPETRSWNIPAELSAGAVADWFSPWISYDDLVARSLTDQEACTLYMRRLKNMQERAQRIFYARCGTPEEQARFIPLVLRNQFRMNVFSSMPDTVTAISRQGTTARKTFDDIRAMYKKYGVGTVLDNEKWIGYDGDQFTFFPPEQQEVTYLTCNHPDEIDGATNQNYARHSLYDIQNGKCDDYSTEKVMETKQQLKHNVGNWNCNACMVDGTNATVTTTMPPVTELRPGMFKFVKATKWCPNFVAGGVGPQIARYGVEKLYDAISSKVDKLCFAGIMHIQMTPLDGKVQMDYMCDTCGLHIREVLDAAPQGEHDAAE